MPASRSPGPDTKPTPRPRSYWPVVLIGVAALLAVIITILPASIAAHFLPPSVLAEDFSGTVWHGSAGRITVNARDAGALEWRLHPEALLGTAVAADLHWVKVGFVIDATVKIDRQGMTLHGIKGRGSVEDLNDMGFAVGWRGSADVDFSELKSDFARPLAAVGDIRVSNLTSARIADGAELGSYDLRLPEGAVDADGNVSAQLRDTGGPLDAQAVLHYSAKERTGLLTGTIRERPDAPPALRSQLESLSQLRPRDPQGRIALDLEFAL
jgi:hypothetical protein